MTIRRGDVFWAKVAGGRRPVVVMTRNAAIPLLHTITVAPATRIIRDIPSEIQLSRADGMPEDCAVSLDNLQGVPKRELRSRITSLAPQRLDELCEALGYALGC